MEGTKVLNEIVKRVKVAGMRDGIDDSVAMFLRAKQNQYIKRLVKVAGDYVLGCYNPIHYEIISKMMGKSIGIAPKETRAFFNKLVKAMRKDGAIMEIE